MISGDLSDCLMQDIFRVFEKNMVYHGIKILYMVFCN